MLLTVLFKDWLDERQNPNRKIVLSQGGEDISVLLQRNRSGHYVAPGHINGKQVDFLLDTGATEVAVPERLSRRLGLEKGPLAETITANGRTKVWRTTIASIQMGPFEQRNISGLILPNMQGNQVLLGMSFLKELELLQRGDHLRIRVPDLSR